jgi:hypothetical protein
LSGTAGPEKYGTTNFDFDAGLSNDSTDLVVTSFRIVISMPDGKQISKTFAGKFIQPGQFQHFIILANEMKGDYFSSQIEMPQTCHILRRQWLYPAAVQYFDL